MGDIHFFSDRPRHNPCHPDTDYAGNEAPRERAPLEAECSQQPFLARGEDLVHLVFLVYLVSLVHLVSNAYAFDSGDTSAWRVNGGFRLEIPRSV